MNSHELLREEIKNKAVVHGKVILSSGKEADYYVDLRRITLDHVAAPLVGQVMLDLTKDLDFEAVGGLTLGADPVATAMMHVAASQGRALNSFVVRKAEKAHGYNAASKDQMSKASVFWLSKILPQPAVQY
jgi:orotate phosphoribosyltransferase